MKLALISIGLFLLSYVLVNGGLGSNPFTLVVPLLVVVGSTLAVGSFMRRGRGPRAPKSKAFDPDSLPVAPQPRASAPPSPRPPGGKARKLF